MFAQIEPSDPKLDYEQIKLLFDYTKFHIGVYTTLASSLIALMGLKKVGWAIAVLPSLLWVAVVAIAIAGFAGGVIASSLPHHKSISSFWNTGTGPFRSTVLRGEYWTYIEHTAFWVGLISAILSFMLGVQ